MSKNLAFSLNDRKSVSAKAAELRKVAEQSGDREGLMQFARELLPDDQRALLDHRREERRLAEGTAALAATGIFGNTGGASGAKPVPDFRSLLLTDDAHRLIQADGVRALTSGTTLGNGGRLPPDVADTFIDFLIAQQPTLNAIQTRRMNANQAHLDQLVATPRTIRKLTEGTSFNASDAIDTKRRTMTAIEIGWAEDVTLHFIEDNIEKRNAEAHIARILAMAVGNDLEDLGWNGDDGSGDPFISINNGWIDLALADADVVDYDATSGGAGDDDTCALVLRHTLAALPAKFRNRADLAFFVPWEFSYTYAQELAARPTALGDAVIVGGRPSLAYHGVPLIATTALTAAGRKLFLTPRENLVFGIQRQITVDSEWKPRTRLVEYTLTARVDFEYVEGEAIVHTHTIATALL